MRLLTLAILTLSSHFVFSQTFDFYGPAPFGEILDRGFAKAWNVHASQSVENRDYFILMDASTQTQVVRVSPNDRTSLEIVNVESVTETYGSVMHSLFQLVDINADLNNTDSPLAGKYQVNPVMHSFFAWNADANFGLVNGDGGSATIAEEEIMGYLEIEFDGDPSAILIKASAQWVYNSAEEIFEQNSAWSSRWLRLQEGQLSWTDSENTGTSFFMADAHDLIDLEIESTSDFNPVSVAYQPNATAAIPEDAKLIEDSDVLVRLPMDLDAQYEDQLGNSTVATEAVTNALDEIEITLSDAGFNLRYPKAFYLAVRANMLSQKVVTSDIYGSRLGYQTVPDVFFTNAKTDDGTPHPFMVITSHIISTRPNLLRDVNRPPGADPGVGYAESTVTRNGKLGEFLIKIPLRDYGLIDNLLENDLSAYNDLAADFDLKQGTTTNKDVYNYASIASSGVAVDGVTIYPAYNNNLRFAVEDAEVTHSGIHVGGGLELHYHADGHAYSGNGINLYNIADYDGHDHPPVIGLAYDGIALFGKYESNYPDMIGSETALDEFGGHDHGDDFGYHYHAHTQEVHASDGTAFNEHFLLVGAWKGNINDIPGFLEVKLNQLNDEISGRFAGAPYDESGVEDPETVLSVEAISDFQIFPNPVSETLFLKAQKASTISIYNLEGKLVKSMKVVPGVQQYSIKDISRGVYLIRSSHKDLMNKLIIR